MIKDFFVSFGDNFKEKTKNPFLGTYLLVWLIRNWELVYALFNFDSNLKLNNKVAFIKAYYYKQDFVSNLFSNIYLTFLVLIITYILVNISRFIVNLSEKRLTPWIYKITDSKSIVLKTSFDKLLSDRDDLQSRLDSERESKSRLENRIKNLEIEIIELTTPKADAEIEQSTKEKNGSDSFTILTSKVYEKLKKDELVKGFQNAVVNINKGLSFHNSKNPDMDAFIELGLLKFTKQNYDGSGSYYEVTTLGEAVLNLIRLD